jgi:hypothetical protein
VVRSPHLVQDLVVLVDLALAGLDLLAQLGQLFFSALQLRPNQVALHFADLLHRVPCTRVSSGLPWRALI